jgi:Raf kinase inhibitor-like YbhB/YbcL family protein
MSSQPKSGSFSISSKAFQQNARIPRQYTGDGEDRSPPLEWKGVPKGARKLALVCHDPDAPMPGGFTHWVVYGIPPEATGIPEGGGRNFVQGVNSTGRPGYMGPAPPRGHGVHHYNFMLYALGEGPEPKPGMGRQDLLAAIRGLVIGEALLVGTYER